MNRNKTLRQLLNIFLLTLALLIPILLTSLYFVSSEKHSKVENIKENSVVIVLGAGLWGDQVSPQLSLRLKTAMELINKNNKILTIVSGGQGSDELVSEAEAMKKYLVELGTDSENIYLEDKSTSTRENLEFSRSLIEELGLKNPEIIIVTTDFHMFRAKMIAKRLGLSALGHSAPNVPSIIIKNNVREVFALLKDFLIQ